MVKELIDTGGATWDASFGGNGKVRLKTGDWLGDDRIVYKLVIQPD